MNNNKLDLTLRPSRYFFTLISGVHLIILLACISKLKLIFLIIIVIFIIYSYVYLVNKFVYRTYKYSVLKLRIDENFKDPNQWVITFKGLEDKSARLKPNGYLSDFLIIMHFEIIKNYNLLNFRSKFNLLNLLLNYLSKKLNRKTIAVLIFPDMLDYSDYHRVKLYLSGYLTKN